MAKRWIGRVVILLLWAATALGLLATGALADSGEDTAWAVFQRQLNNGGAVALSEDLTAASGEDALTVPAGAVVTLDLAGHTLSRGLESAVENGFVLRNEGTLTITDSVGGGIITGGFNSGNGGGLVNRGALTFEAGTITGNAAGESAGGVWNQEGAVFSMTGGAIIGNTAVGWHGGGVYNGGTMNLSGGSITLNVAGGTLGSGQGGGILNNGVLNVSGAPDVSGNTGLSGNNIFLRAAHPAMTVTGTLTDGANLYVTSASGMYTVTAGYGDHNTAHPARFFHPDNTAYGIALVEGEAKIDQVFNAVPYVDHRWNGTELTAVAAFAEEARAVPSDGGITGGWYYLNSNVTRNGRIESITGDVRLILGDGCTLDVKGLYVPPDTTLTVYGQSGGSGKIISNPGGGAGIGGYKDHDNGDIVIHGGTIEAHGYDNCAGIGSNSNQKTGDITIYGGTVTADSRNNGAGIGAGRNSDGGNITIYGGVITATGADSSAGIGGGDASGSYADSSVIRIYGGTVNATGHDKGAGIGGGEYGHATVSISGGTVNATGGGEGGAGIGDGADGSGSAITLGYTDTSKDTVSITAGSYHGAVELHRSFSTGSAVIYPCTLTDLNQIAGRTLVACDGPVDSWAMLQTVISGAPDGATIPLTDDLTAAVGDTALTVGDRNITIDMNGKTLNRNRTSSAEDGQVFLVGGDATLTLRNGVLTGGFAPMGGGICNSGALIMTDCTVSGNAGAAGGGIYNSASGHAALTGCAVTGNSATGDGGGIFCDSGSTMILNGLNSVTANESAGGSGGVHVSQGASLSVSGKPVAEGNRQGDAASNIFLAGDSVIQICGALDDGARMGVSGSGGSCRITGDYGAYNTVHPEIFFFPDSPDCTVFRVSDEAWIVSVTAVSSWEELGQALGQSGRILVSGDIMASESDSLLTVPDGVSVELDLRGHRLDASALKAPEEVYVGCLTIRGSLTLSDTAGGGGFSGGSGGFTDVIVADSGSVFTLNGGTVTGSGSGLEDVVSVFSGGSFTMNGGAVTGDLGSGDEQYGRIYVFRGASFTMNSGTVSGSGGKADIFTYGGSIGLNGGSLAGSRQEYGNVYVDQYSEGPSGRISVSGSPGMNAGVYLAAGHAITVAGALGPDVSIPVMTGEMPTDDTPVIITEGLARGGENAVARFTSAYDACYVALNDSGEAEFRKTPTDWDALQQLIDSAGNDAVLILTRDYTALAGDSHLDIASGKTLTIDLNGHTLDGSALRDDDVLLVSGSLKLQDPAGGGAILGQDGSSVVACVSDQAVFHLESGVISGVGCRQVVHAWSGSFIMNGGAVNAGGEGCHYAVYAYDGMLTLTGGAIHADPATTEGAVWIRTFFCMQGSPDITGNIVLSQPIHITGPVDSDVRISICPTSVLWEYYNNVITDGLSGNGTADNFIPHDPESWMVGLDESGEALLGVPVTVSFAPGDEAATGVMDTITVARWSVVPLPDCGFTGPAGHVFSEWWVEYDSYSLEDETAQPGDVIVVPWDITVTAVWREIPFGAPDFLIPDGAETIGESAFEGVAATVAVIPENCAAIGNGAFRNCPSLTMIRIPADCMLGEDVFDGCAKVYVFSAAGSDAQRYCSEHANCVFVVDNPALSGIIAGQAGEDF